MPRQSETPDSSLELVLVNNALARLSPRQYKRLEEFRNVFPTLKLERRASYPNSFFLFRTQFVAKKKKEKGKNHLDNNGVSNNDNTSGSVEVSGGRTNPKIGPKSGSNNQTDYSKEAGIVWRRDCPLGSRQRAYFTSWSHTARDLCRAMHPNGLPALLRAKKKPKSSNKSKVTSPSPSPLSPSVPHKPFQPLPTPPISDSGDLEKDLVRDYRNDDALESEDAFEGSDIDEDYVPKNSSRKRKPSRRKHSNRSLKKKPHLLTPVSMTRELSPCVSSRSPSPTPAFSSSDSTLPLSLVMLDVSLSDLNDEGPSTFTMFSDFCGASYSRGPSEFFEQIAVGYSTEEQDNTIMDWNQTDLMPDLDPVGLFPVVNLPCPSDSLMTEFTNDPSYQPIPDETTSD